jgi:GntR family transcriptional regulator
MPPKEPPVPGPATQNNLTMRVPLCHMSSTVFHRPNPSSGIPIYVQVKEQIRHAIETGALNAGDQLPSIRGLAETLVINPNTLIRVYRELEMEDILEIRHGLGVFVTSRRRGVPKQEDVKKAQDQIRGLVEKLTARGFDTGELRRLFEAALMSQHELQRR